jgi:hypothetical protein
MNITRVNNDINGNPRRVIHFLNLINEQDEETLTKNFEQTLKQNPFCMNELKYNLAVSRAKKYGGKKYHNKKYGGGIAFQEYNDSDVIALVERIMQEQTGEGQKFCRKCDATGEGMNEGFCFGEGVKYFKYKKDATKYAKSLGFKGLSSAYKNDEYYFTDWESDFQYIVKSGKLIDIE